MLLPHVYARSPYSMKYGEKATYDVYFKWGLIMSRAGEAVFSYQKDRSVSGASSRYDLHFKTTKVFDRFFKMRDTIAGYYNTDKKLIKSIKKTNEGGYYSIDKLTFKYGKRNTKIKSLRYTPSKVKIDTVLTAAGDVADLLGAIYHMRSLDRSKLKSGSVFPLTVAIGRDLVKMKLCYHNQAVIDRGKVKYNTLYFTLDIYDEAFESSKTSAEVWIGNDDNLLPVKVRSKLKVGYVEVYLKNASSTAHSLKCRIEIPK